MNFCKSALITNDDELFVVEAVFAFLSEAITKNFDILMADFVDAIANFRNIGHTGALLRDGPGERRLN